MRTTRRTAAAGRALGGLGVALSALVIAAGGGHAAPAPSWRALPLRTGPVLTLAVDPVSPEIVYAGTLDGVSRSVDGGRSWAEAGPVGRGGRVSGLAIDPRAPSTLYAATEEGVFRTTDSGTSWQPAGFVGRMRALVLDPARPSTLYAAAVHVIRRLQYPGFEVLKSTDSGATWQVVFRASAYELSLAVVPGTDTVYLGGSFLDIASVYRSMDGGATWGPVRLGEGVGVLSVSADRDTRAVFLGTNVGVLTSRDGDTWSTLGPTGRVIRALAVGPGGEWIYAGTEAGIFSPTTEGPTGRLERPSRQTRWRFRVRAPRSRTEVSTRACCEPRTAVRPGRQVRPA
jgi:hypothetical protein